MMTAATFTLPEFGQLPARGTASSRLIAFANRFDPTAWLKRLWGCAYTEKACQTWADHWSRFQSGLPAPASAVLILFTLNYDIVSGANLYRHETADETFHQWLIAGLRRTTKPEVKHAQLNPVPA